MARIKIQLNKIFICNLLQRGFPSYRGKCVRVC